MTTKASLFFRALGTLHATTCPARAHTHAAARTLTTSTAPTTLRRPARQTLSFISHQHRHASAAAGRGPFVNPALEQMRAQHGRKNQTTLNYSLAALISTLAFAYASVPFYKMICQTTGWGGQPVRHGDVGDGVDPASRLIPVENAQRIRVTFAGSTSDILPWTFKPQQREVRVLPGETALAFYTATNSGPAPIIGIATYGVTPAQVAPYFSKIQCFCFEEQCLQSSESVDMPVLFYLDPAMLEDPLCRGIETVTLNYTFFMARYDNNGKLEPVAGA